MHSVHNRAVRIVLLFEPLRKLNRFDAMQLVTNFRRYIGVAVSLSKFAGCDTCINVFLLCVPLRLSTVQGEGPLADDHCQHQFV